MLSTIIRKGFVIIQARHFVSLVYGVSNSPYCHESSLTLSFWEFFVFLCVGGGVWLVHWPSPVYIYLEANDPTVFLEPNKSFKSTPYQLGSRYSWILWWNDFASSCRNQTPREHICCTKSAWSVTLQVFCCFWYSVCHQVHLPTYFSPSIINFHGLKSSHKAPTTWAWCYFPSPSQSTLGHPAVRYCCTRWPWGLKEVIEQHHRTILGWTKNV